MKVLFVMYQKTNTIPDGGDKCNLRNIEIVKHICGDENVDYYFIIKDPKSIIIDALSFYINIFSNYYRGINKKIIQEIIDLSKQYDTIFLCSSLFGIIAKELKDSRYKGKIATQFHNVEKEYYKAVYPLWLPLRNKILDCIYQNEKMAAMYSNKVLALNERDGKLIEHEYGININFYDPITLPDNFDISKISEQQTGKKPRCTFIGSYFPPNVDGVLWFVKEVLPHVNIEFIVVGRNMDVLHKKHKCLRNIKIISNVPDLSEYYLNTDFVVLPIFSGSGMKVKTCESLMYGRNIIGTKEAFEGYSLDFDRVGGLCNTAKDFIDTINRYAKHPIQKLNIYSRRVYLEKYSSLCLNSNEKFITLIINDIATGV